MVLFVAPLGVWLARPSPYVVAQHIVVCMPFLYVLAAHWLARAGDRWRGGKVLWAVVMTVFTLGSAVRTGHLLVEGRGSYREAVLFMAEHTAGASVTVGTDRDFRNKMLIHYYSRYLVPLGKKNRLLRTGRVAGTRTGMADRHRLDPACKPLAGLVQKTRHLRSRAPFPCRGPSGSSWFLYHKATSP